jgi:uncharacterized protein (DUF924 family)
MYSSVRSVTEPGKSFDRQGPLKKRSFVLIEFSHADDVQSD